MPDPRVVSQELLPNCQCYGKKEGLALAASPAACVQLQAELDREWYASFTGTHLMWDSLGLPCEELGMLT